MYEIALQDKGAVLPVFSAGLFFCHNVDWITKLFAGFLVCEIFTDCIYSKR